MDWRKLDEYDALVDASCYLVIIILLIIAVCDKLSIIN
jgi:hypothetical protein